MSRHRNFRNLDEDDYYDDDYYDDDEYYDEDEYYIEQQREQERKKKEEAERKAKENKLKQQKLQQQKKQQQKLKQQQMEDAKKNKAAGGKGGGGISVASAPKKSSGGGISLGKPPPGFTVESKKTDTATKANNAQNMPIPQLPPNILASLRSNSTTGEVIRSHLSMVILGHVDAGKSTLTGRLLLSLNHVSQRLLQKYQKAATSIGKSSFALAWFTDEDDSERERGVTIDIGTKFAKTEKFDFTILDAPGHKDFIPNMISGTASADCGLLVVAATTGEFEAGFARGGDASYSGGQTREHIVLSRGLGVTQFVVAVNKLDAAEPAWSQDRFEHIKSMVLDFLIQNGFKEARITFVPVSGLTGVNISNSDKVEDEEGWKALKKWYRGPTLLEALNGFAPAKRGYEKPLRAIVTDVSSEGKNVNVRGRVVQGFIQSGDNVAVLPVGDDATVVRVERGKAAQEGSSPYSFASPSAAASSSSTANEALLDGIALAGDTVELTLANIDSARLMTGCVICHPHPSLRPKVEQRFEARISVMERLAVPIIRGSQVLLHMHSIDVPAVLNKLVSSEKRGEKPRQNPRVLTGGVTATVEITLSERLVIEESNECKALGRFVLRRGGDTISVGLIDKVLG